MYVSDIKRLIGWYNILEKHELLKFDEENTDSEESKEDAETDSTDDNNGENKA